MASARGPLGSFAAQGTLSKILTYRRSLRGTTILRAQKPHDPKTAKQWGRRTLLRLLQAMWDPTDQDTINTWKDPPEISNAAAYRRYLSKNLLEFPQYLCPIITPERYEGGLTWHETNPQQILGPRRIQIKTDQTGLGDPEAYLIYRAIGEIPTPSIDTLRGFQWGLAVHVLDFTDMPITGGPYGYKACRFAYIGLLSAYLSWTPESPLP